MSSCGEVLRGVDEDDDETEDDRHVCKEGGGSERLTKKGRKEGRKEGLI